VSIDLAHAAPAEARGRFRASEWTGVTSGMCLGHLQANLAVLAAEEADEFLRFCEANPRPMPLVDVTEPGDPVPRRAAPGADLRTDLPRYRVHRHGELAGEPTDVRDLWRDDLVAFLLGCSFTAESALLAAGVRLRHMERGQNVPVFVTTIPCTPVGRFHGPLVVSMRPIASDRVELARRVTAGQPLAHGAPIHVGDPAEIGILDLARPDYGDPIEPEDDEVPVFWACGVTPQAVIAAAKPEFAITHAPGHMFITDLGDAEARRWAPTVG
jgi:uncharacterized protein YcsI (UPF0317 family)